MSLLDTFIAPIRAKIGLVVGVAVVAVVLAAGAYILMLRGEISSLNKKVGELNGTIVVLKQNSETLKGNIKTLQNVNNTNGETIAKMLEERKKSDAAVASLAKKDLANTKKIKDLNAYIDTLTKDPTKDGALAPVLVETLKAIQERKAGAQ